MLEGLSKANHDNGQLKQSLYEGIRVLDSTAILTVSQATRLGKGSSVVINCLRQVFVHQELVAVIDGQL